MSEIKNTSVIEVEDIDDSQFNELIDNTITDFDEGDLVSGIVVKIEHDEVLLDIGFKSEGVIPSRELSIRRDADPSEIVSINERIEALVLQKEDKDGRLILSKKRAEYERAWIDIEQKFSSGENVIGEVIEVVKGGLILDIGLRGFLPASLVDLRRVKDLESFTGEMIEARVIEMDRNRNNVVLSRRVVLEEGRRNERSEILEKLTKGMRLKGTVSSLVDFGAFVDLGGIDGLVHISELSWNHVGHPSEVVKVGDEVEVEVLEVDLSRERISLGLKQTTEDPWRQMVKNYPVGAILEGKVTKLLSFGAFVELGFTIEGLVHISEMASRHIISPTQVVHVGSVVHVKVIDIDQDRRRISLSMKAAAETLGIEIEISEPDPSLLKPKQPKERKARGSSEEAPAEKTLEEVIVEEGLQEVVAAPEADAAAAESAEPVETPSEDAVEEAVVEETAVEETAVEEAAPEEAVVEEAVAEEAVAEEAVAESVEEAVVEDVIEEAAAEAVEETDVEETAVEEAAPEEAAPEEAAPEEAIVEEATAQETAPEEALIEEPAEEAKPVKKPKKSTKAAQPEDEPSEQAEMSENDAT